MVNDCIFIKFFSNGNMNPNNLKVKLINEDDKIVYDGKTDFFGKIKIPICNNRVYKLLVYSNFLILKIPLIAKKNETYCINISDNKINPKKHLVTIMLVDKYNPSIKIKGGEIIIWQDIQSK